MNSNESNKEIINKIWGSNNQSREIERVFDKFNLSVSKLIKCCDNKGQNILVAVGAVLGMKDLNDILVQCECGEIMGFREVVYNELLKHYDNGKIKCKRCDRKHFDKLIQVQHKLEKTGLG